MGGCPGQERAHPSPIRILSLTGSTRVREAIHRGMTRAGFRVEHAPDAAEALRRIEASAPEAVIVSVPLADADALEICRLIRASAGGRRTAILLVAPRDFEARSQATALDSGADACVAGNNPDLLAATVRALLRAHPEGRQLEIEHENLIRSLRESEERFRALVDQASDGFFVHDDEGSFVDVNQRACQSLGYTRTELLQMSVFDVEMDYDLVHAQREWRSIRSGEARTLVGRHKRKDGSIFDVEVRLSVCLMAGERLYLGLVRDITERRAMEDRLRRALADASSSRSQLEAVFGAMQEGVIVFDKHSKVVLMNDALARVAGYADAAVVPRDMREFGQFELSKMDGTPVPLRESPGSRLLRGESFQEVERRVRRTGNGGEWIVSFSGKPVYDAGGKQVLAVMVLRDITARKRAEERMILAQKMESIGLLAGGIAHDFNNLLGSIMGYASLLEDEVPRKSVDKLHAILHSSQRAADLTRQLLAYAGKGNFVVQQVDLTRAVHEILQILKASIPGKVRVKEELAPRLPPVEADPGQVQQVVMNLALNGAEAIPQNSLGTVTVCTRLEEIKGGSAPVDELSHAPIAPGPYICLEVRDTGAGMDEATRARIFDPFFTTKFTGRGLGLAAVGGIVRAHRGAVQVASSPGLGTTFRILFPLAGWPRECTPEPPGVATVLVVDDEPEHIADVLRIRRPGAKAAE